jgi:hypothetical protein
VEVEVLDQAADFKVTPADQALLLLDIKFKEELWDIMQKLLLIK